MILICILYIRSGGLYLFSLPLFSLSVLSLSPPFLVPADSQQDVSRVLRKVSSF